MYPSHGNELSMLNYVGTLTSVSGLIQIRQDPEWQVVSYLPEFMRRVPWDRIYALDNAGNLCWHSEHLLENVAAGNEVAMIILGLKYIFDPHHHSEREELLRAAPDLRLRRYGLGVYLVVEALMEDYRCFEDYTPGLQMMIEGREVLGRHVWKEDRAVFVKAMKEIVSRIPKSKKLRYGLLQVLPNLCDRLYCRSWISEGSHLVHQWILEDAGKELCGPHCCALVEVEKVMKEVLMERVPSESFWSGPEKKDVGVSL